MRRVLPRGRTASRSGGRRRKEAELAHIIVLVFALGFPAISTPGYATRRSAILSGDQGLKRREYRETIAWLSAMGIASVVFFLVEGLDLSLLGIALPRSLPGATSLALAAIGSGVLWYQSGVIVKDPESLAAAREALTPVREYFPRGREEQRLFWGVSLAAGLGEELFYRGFLLWYLGAWLPLWAAVVVSSLLFGLAHIMHGLQATIRSTVMGFVFAGLYLAGGSLLAPMLLHTVVDLTSGRTGARAFADTPTATT